MAELCSRDFRDYFAIERGTESADGAGGYTVVWATNLNVFGLIEDSGGDENIVAGRLEPTETITVTCRYSSDILETDRLNIDGKLYNISRLENIDRRSKFLRIYAETGVRT